MRHTSQLYSSRLQIREAENPTEESRTIEGYAIVFGEPSVDFTHGYGKTAVREIIDPAAVTSDLLDGCDIVLNLDHDDADMLARSRRGQGSLSYEVDEHGVKFVCEAPRCDLGDRALEMVRRGDIYGCSFAFVYSDDEEAIVKEQGEVEADGRKCNIYRIKRIDAILDFALVTRPAYEGTSVKTRAAQDEADDDTPPMWVEQVKAMRAAAKFDI